MKNSLKTLAIIASVTILLMILNFTVVKNNGVNISHRESLTAISLTASYPKKCDLGVHSLLQKTFPKQVISFSHPVKQTMTQFDGSSFNLELSSGNISLKMLRRKTSQHSLSEFKQLTKSIANTIHQSSK